MSITSKGRGKSGGARIITYTVLATEENGHIYLMNVFDKSDFSTVELSIIQSMVTELQQSASSHNLEDN